MDRPPVFLDEAFSIALEKTRSSSRLLIVDACAEWCGPCKQMDRTTWRDQTVVAWLQTNAIALQIDVDREREWAQTYQIKAMPTMIAFREGRELDRIVGLRSARQLLDWLQGIQQGESSIEQLRRSVKAEGNDLEKRFDLTRALLEAGNLNEATDEFAYLWERVIEVNYETLSVPWGLLRSDVSSLITQSELARSRFGQIRDRKAVEAQILGQARLDWVLLNEVLGEGDVTLAWFDEIGAGGSERLHLPDVAHRLIPLLLSQNRWADASRLINEGLEYLARCHAYFGSDEFPSDTDEELKSLIIESNRQDFRRTAAQLRQMLIAGNRVEEAAAVEQKALSLDPSDQMKEWLAKPRDEILT